MQFSFKMKFEYKRPHHQARCASARSTSAKSSMCPAPVGDLVQVRKFIFARSAQVLYNYCIDERETKMTDSEFFRQIQDDWFHEFAGAERHDIFVATHVQDENFEFDDVPY